MLCPVVIGVVAFGLAVGAGGAAGAHTAGNHKPGLYVSTGGEGGEVFAAGHFPRLIWVTEQDYLSGLSWKGAGRETATATGTFNHDDCLPNCARGGYVRFAIKLTAADPEWCTVTLYNRQLVSPRGGPTCTTRLPRAPRRADCLTFRSSGPHVPQPPARDPRPPRRH